MKKEFLDKESKAKREKNFTRIYLFSLLTALVGSLLFLIFVPENLELTIMAMLMVVMVFQMIIFIWVFRLQYHLVPTLLKDDDESMELDEVP